jgi:hypothetical protein
VAVDASNAVQAAAAAASKPAKPLDVPPEPLLADGSPYAPIDADEVTAFRQAIAKGVRPERKPRPAADQNYTLLTGFEQTEIREDKPADVLSGSQYGDLR